MAKKPKEKWQIAVRTKCDEKGISYQDIADGIGRSEGVVRAAMSVNGQSYGLLKKEILEYVGVENDDY